MTISAPIELLLADIRDAFAKEGEAPVANMAVYSLTRRSQRRLRLSKK